MLAATLSWPNNHVAAKLHEVGLKLLQLEDELHVNCRSNTNTVECCAEVDNLCLDLVTETRVKAGDTLLGECARVLND